MSIKYSIYYHIWIFAHVDGVSGVKMLLLSRAVVEVVVHMAHLHCLQSLIGKPRLSKMDEFPDKFRTARHPPRALVSKKFGAFFFNMCLFTSICKTKMDWKLPPSPLPFQTFGQRKKSATPFIY